LPSVRVRVTAGPEVLFVLEQTPGMSIPVVTANRVEVEPEAMVTAPVYTGEVSQVVPEQIAGVTTEPLVPEVPPVRVTGTEVPMVVPPTALIFTFGFCTCKGEPLMEIVRVRTTKAHASSKGIA